MGFYQVHAVKIIKHFELQNFLNTKISHEYENIQIQKVVVVFQKGILSFVASTCLKRFKPGTKPLSTYQRGHPFAPLYSTHGESLKAVIKFWQEFRDSFLEFLLTRSRMVQDIRALRVRFRLKWTTIIRNLNYTAPMFQQYFDTNKFMQKLETEGFSRQQGEAIMESLAEVMNER